MIVNVQERIATVSWKVQIAPFVIISVVQVKQWRLNAKKISAVWEIKSIVLAVTVEVWVLITVQVIHAYIYNM